MARKKATKTTITSIPAPKPAVGDIWVDANKTCYRLASVGRKYAFANLRRGTMGKFGKEQQRVPLDEIASMALWRAAA